MEEGFDCTGNICLDIQSPSATLNQTSHDEDDYTIILSFSEPVIIQESLKDNISISISSRITSFTWDLEATEVATYNAYKL